MRIADGPGGCESARDRLIAGGVIAGPLFVSAFTVLGLNMNGYDARRDPVSALALGQRGWIQRTNFIITGALYLGGAVGLALRPRGLSGSRASDALLAGAGLGLIGSGVFLTDAAGRQPGLEVNGRRGYEAGSGERRQLTREAALHDLCALPIFVGIPAAAAISARDFAKRGNRGWARYSGGSAALMGLTFVLFGAAFAQAPRLVAWGGLLQRISIATGFGWITALSVRARRTPVPRS